MRCASSIESPPTQQVNTLRSLPAQAPISTATSVRRREGRRRIDRHHRIDASVGEQRRERPRPRRLGRHRAAGPADCPAATWSQRRRPGAARYRRRARARWPPRRSSASTARLAEAVAAGRRWRGGRRPSGGRAPWPRAASNSVAERVDAHPAGAAQCRFIDIARRKRAWPAGPAVEAAAADRDHRLVARRRPRRGHELAAGRHRCRTATRMRLGIRVFGQPVEDVGQVDVEAGAEVHDGGKADARAGGAVHDRRGDGSGLRTSAILPGRAVTGETLALMRSPGTMQPAAARAQQAHQVRPRRFEDGLAHLRKLRAVSFSRIDGPTITARMPRSPSSATMAGTLSKGAQMSARSGTNGKGSTRTRGPRRRRRRAWRRPGPADRRSRRRQGYAARCRRSGWARQARRSPRSSRDGEKVFEIAGLSWLPRVAGQHDLIITGGRAFEQSL